MSGRLAWPIALAALAVAFAWPMQVGGFNQNAHYALVRAIAVHHVPYVDQSLGEIGDLSSGDVSRFEGHTYAAKAPGVALVSVPAFLVVDAIGMRTTGDPTRVLWALHLWTIVLPALALLVLLKRTGEALEPGLGTPSAITFGIATLMLPFATLFFSHVPAAALGFAAFALAFAERRAPPRLVLVAAAGTAAGLAVTFEYPLVFAAAIVGVYAVARPGFLRRALAYCAGGLVGVLPLLVFNAWAFGSPLHIAYEDYYAERGEEVGGVFGFGLPHLGTAYDLLFSAMGLVTLTPVIVLGVFGGVLLVRERRAEAVAVLAVIGTYLLYNSSLRHASPFGGQGPPRYLFPMLPFAALPFAVAFRKLPLTTLALGIVSAFSMVVATATGALAMYDWQWLERATDRTFAETAAAVAGITGWYAIVPFFVAVAVAAAIGVLSLTRLAVTRVDLAAAAALLAGWSAIALAADNPYGVPPPTGYVLALALAAMGTVVAVALVARRASQTVSAAPTTNRTAEQSGQVTA